MKVIYKNTELQHNTKSYNVLINRPSLNGHLLEGNVSLDTLSLYDKPTVDTLVEATSQIRLVTEMPADPEPNMTYYVGPDERDLYDVILVNDAKQQIHMGTTQFGQYKSGPGVNVKFDNTININTDEQSIYIDSEGKIASSLDGDTLPAFTGATASVAGQKGLAPKPLVGQQNSILFGNSSWVDIIDYLLPVKTIYLTYSSATDPNVAFPGTTWEKLDSGYSLMTDATGGLEKVRDGVPNIEGAIGIRPNGNGENHAFAAFVSGGKEIEGVGFSLNGTLWSTGMGNCWVHFCASDSLADGKEIYGTRPTTGNPKGKSDTVQPPAIKVVAWRRTA